MPVHSISKISQMTTRHIAIGQYDGACGHQVIRLLLGSAMEADAATGSQVAIGQCDGGRCGHRKSGCYWEMRWRQLRSPVIIRLSKFVGDGRLFIGLSDHFIAFDVCRLPFRWYRRH
jgi:hypothetical protein